MLVGYCPSVPVIFHFTSNDINQSTALVSCMSLSMLQWFNRNLVSPLIAFKCIKRNLGITIHSHLKHMAFDLCSKKVL